MVSLRPKLVFVYLFAASPPAGLQQYNRKDKSVALHTGTPGPAASPTFLCVIHGTGATRGSPGDVKDDHPSHPPDAAPMMSLLPRHHYAACHPPATRLPHAAAITIANKAAEAIIT